MIAKAAFMETLLTRLLASVYDSYPDNYPDYFADYPDNVAVDPRPSPTTTVRSRATRWVEARLIAFLQTRGYTLAPSAAADPPRLDARGVQWSALASLYDRLGDESSRRLLIDLIAYRVLGYQRVRLPLAENNFYRQRVDAMRTLATDGQRINIAFMGWSLRCFDLARIGYPIKLFTVTGGVVNAFDLKQYEYRATTPPIKAMQGDVVIDAGGCWGDTALYFAHETHGRVYSFEFVPSNLDIMRRNLQMNPDLGGLIDVVPNPLWGESGRRLFFRDNGPGSQVSFEPQGSDAQVETISIDDFVRQQGIARIDFIKMDIEGAEIPALRGATEVIRRFKPKLAISVYHRPTDITAIPAWIETCGVPYDIYLGHYTIHNDETVLFAIPKSS